MQTILYNIIVSKLFTVSALTFGALLLFECQKPLAHQECFLTKQAVALILVLHLSI